MELWQILALIGGSAAALVIWLVYQRHADRWVSWAEFAKRRKLTFLPPQQDCRARIVGCYGDTPVEIGLQMVREGEGEDSEVLMTRFSSFFSRSMPSGMHLSSPGFQDELAVYFEAPRVQIGFDVLDDGVSIRAYDEKSLRSLMSTERARNAVSEFLLERSRGAVTLHRASLLVKGIVRNGKKLEEGLDAVVAVVKDLERSLDAQMEAEKAVREPAVAVEPVTAPEGGRAETERQAEPEPKPESERREQERRKAEEEEKRKKEERRKAEEEKRKEEERRKAEEEEKRREQERRKAEEEEKRKKEERRKAEEEEKRKEEERRKAEEEKRKEEQRRKAEEEEKRKEEERRKAEEEKRKEEERRKAEEEEKRKEEEERRSSAESGAKRWGIPNGTAGEDEDFGEDLEIDIEVMSPEEEGENGGGNAGKKEGKEGKERKEDVEEVVPRKKPGQPIVLGELEAVCEEGIGPVERRQLIKRLRKGTAYCSLTVDEVTWTTGVGLKRSIMMGRTVVGSVGPDVIVGVRFAKTENDRIRKLTTGDKLQIKARVVDWDDLDKRLIMEAI